ncbi:MAG: mercuric reductase [Planctomycetes bacterium]|nr:mercuric reductase [Planctomycetota bacterium]
MSTSATEQFDAIIIGSGQGGKPLCLSLANAGWKTAILERQFVGGTCINYGCTPTKTMVASARVAYLARRGADYGVQDGAVRVDLAKVRKRKRSIVESFRSGSQKKLESTPSVTLLFGEGRFTGPKTIEIALNDGGTRRLTAERIFINTGGRPAVPPLPGLDTVPALDSTSIMELDEVPRHLLVLGGGYIGLEFAQMFRRFGSDVTIVQRGPQLLAREDADVADEVNKVLRQDGIEVLLQTDAVRVAKEGGDIRLTVRTGSGERTLTGSHLLVAAGRVPNTDRLDLKAAGVETNEGGYVRVNDRLETNVPGVYALGDVKGGPAFTHISYDDFRILETNLLKKGSESTKGRMVPYTVFIDPQLGHIGLHEEEARQQGRKVRVAKMPMTWVARALETDESRGLVKATVDADSGEILGCTVLGLEGGEVMTMVQIAMMGKLPYTALRDATFSHPGLGEGLNTLFMYME